MGCGASRAVDDDAHKALEDQVAKLQQQCSEYQRQVQDLTGQLQTTTAELAKAKGEVIEARASAAAAAAVSSSVPVAEAVPSIGTSLRGRGLSPAPLNGSKAAPLEELVPPSKPSVTARQEAAEAAEAARAAEEFARQLKAAEGLGFLPPAQGSPGTRRSSQQGDPEATEQAGADALLPPVSMFPRAHPRSKGDRGESGRSRDQSGVFAIPNHSSDPLGMTLLPSPASSSDRGQLGSSGAADLNATQRYDRAKPSDFKLAQQLKQGPRQGFL